MAGEGLNTLGQLGAGITQAGVNYAFANLESAKAKERNMELMKYANEMSIENWQKMNEYNAPSAQMKRLAEAGLNPNMMYGTGQGANTASDIGKVSAPTMQYRLEPPQMLGILGQFQDLKMKQAQIDNVNAQTKTRELENQYLDGSMISRIDKAMFDAGLSRERGSIQNAIYNGLALYGGGNDYTGQYYKDKYEQDIAASQESVRSVRLQNEMRVMENEWYKALKAMGAGSDIMRTIIPIIQMFMPRKTQIIK